MTERNIYCLTYSPGHHSNGMSVENLDPTTWLVELDHPNTDVVGFFEGVEAPVPSEITEPLAAAHAELQRERAASKLARKQDRQEYDAKRKAAAEELVRLGVATL